MLAAAFDMVDPRGDEPFREQRVGSKEVDPHPEVAGVVESVVPPCEATLTRSPSAGVEVDEPDIEHRRQRIAFGLSHMGKTNEGIGVEDVAIGSRHVDVAADDE